ncbi:uncharacterized protein LOC141902182 [Tubulanus polymorphus]|uniref:uncharacterized protein LOC141902182 n=1 Tax=Tubulanus polymorphus TaxID=672921 RepID=UPI003DA48261
MRRPIPPEERFLATGESFRSISYAHRVGERTISAIVRETCQAIYSMLKGTYLKTPKSEGVWKQVAKNFHEKWNYPLCMGALDGKHIQIRQPDCTGSTFFNYKHFFSVVLLALVDADNQFLYIDVGACGRSGWCWCL